jgi:nitrate/nitrite transporter NarK
MDRKWLTMLALVVSGEAIFALPFVLARIFRPTLLEVFAIDNTQLGVAFSVYGVVAMASYFPGGPLADRFSARRMMIAALLATAAGGAVYATIPDTQTLSVLFGWWGMTTILLFWAAMLRATREWGGDDTQGAAYGILDGGRGLIAALFASISVAVFSSLLGVDPSEATLAQKRSALQSIIVLFAVATAGAAVLVALLVPDPEPSADTGDDDPGFEFADVLTVLKMPALWLQALIVVCAYVGYKGTDDLSLLTADALGYDDVEAAFIGTLAFWIRPVAAIGAGLIADRVGGSRVLTGCFALLTVSNLVVAWSAGAGIPAVLLGAIVGTCAAVFALRGVYFAIFGEAKVPLEVTGTAIGVVSVVGYTPDVFFGPMMRYLLDSAPGVPGHQQLFVVLAVFSAVGGATTLAFQWLVGQTSETSTAGSSR